MAISQAQIYSAIRYAGVMVSGAGTFAVALSILPADTVAGIVPAFQQFATDLQKTISDAYVLFYLLVPAVGLLLAKFGWNSASLTKQLQSIASHGDVQINGQISVPPDVAAAVNHPNIVSNGAKS